VPYPRPVRWGALTGAARISLTHRHVGRRHPWFESVSGSFYVDYSNQARRIPEEVLSRRAMLRLLGGSEEATVSADTS